MSSPESVLPEHAAAWRARAEDAFDRWNTEEFSVAIHQIEALADANPQAHGLAALLRAQQALREWAVADALRHLTRADTLVPQGQDPCFDIERDVAAGYIFNNTGQFEVAIDALSKAWRKIEQLGEGAPVRAGIRCAMQLGTCALSMEQIDRAEGWHAQALQLAKSSCNDLWEAHVLINQSTTKLARGDHAHDEGDEPTAIAAWRQAWELTASIATRFGGTLPAYLGTGCRLAHAEAAIKLGALPAEPVALAGFDDATAPDDLRCYQAGIRARWHAARGEHRLSMEWADRALRLAESHPKRELLNTSLGVAIDLAARRGDLATEAAMLRRQRDLLVALQMDVAERHAQTAAILLDTERALREAAEARARLLTLAAENQALRRQTEALSVATQQDPLTGLTNRRGFDFAFAPRQAAARQSGHALPVAMVDIDHFKRINDQHGHPAGDAVLFRLAELLKARCRPGDMVARLGGEEFAVVFDCARIEQAARACERLRAAVQADPWGQLVPGSSVTISIGVADAAKLADPSEGLAQADKLLYAAKRRGRNCVVAA